MGRFVLLLIVYVNSNKTEFHSVQSYSEGLGFNAKNPLIESQGILVKSMYGNLKNSIKPLETLRNYIRKKLSPKML